MSIDFKIQASIFRKLLVALKDVASDVCFVCSPNGIQVQTMDSGHIALIILNIWKDAFESYHCPQKTEIGLHLPSLIKVTNMNGSEWICIRKGSEDEDDDENEDVLHVSLSSDEQNLDFQLKLLSIEAEDMQIPPIQYDVVTQLSSSYLANAFKTLANFSDKVEIVVEKDKNCISMMVDGDEGTGCAQLKKIHSLQVSNDFTGIFALKQLVTFSKSKDISPMVNIKMHDSTPILIEYVAFPSENQQKKPQISLSYFLAPRISDG